MIIHLFLTPAQKFAAKSGPPWEQGCLTQLQLLPPSGAGLCSPLPRGVGTSGVPSPAPGGPGTLEDVGMDGVHLAAGQVVVGLFMARVLKDHFGEEKNILSDTQRRH